MFINQKANKLPLKQNNSCKNVEILSKSQLLLWKGLNLTTENKSSFFVLWKYTDIIVDKAKQMNKRDQKKVCKEKKTDIKHVKYINQWKRQ